ncbi:MAG TPA: hypothetical protein VEX43_11650 [Chthoniobacterales bacterium]|nr:hypothetical protein [Chthoniobacterales bacterium]
MIEPTATEHQIAPIELMNYKLERAKYRSEIFKWISIAIGAAVSFAVIDYGKLRLEQARLASENQLKLIEAYSKATEAADPEIWKRKLDVLKLFATDDSVRDWADRQLSDIKNFAALDALYRETLRTASQIIDPLTVNDPERIKARRRFEQLYWSDLPFAGEPVEVEKAMLTFRTALVATEMLGTDASAWSSLNGHLIDLSAALRKATHASSQAPSS